MGFRYRKSIKVGGARMNLSKSGIGYSVGTKGFRFTKKAGGGTRTTTSVPGTGISFVKDSKKQSRRTDEFGSQRHPDDDGKKKKVKGPWWAWALIAAVLIGGCFRITDKPDQAELIETTVETTVPQTEVMETVATEPTTLPPARPPEEVLPEIEKLVADIPNANVYVEGGMLCVETCDEVTTGTGSIAYDQLDGGADAWQKVIDSNVALCLSIRTKMDDNGVTDTPAKVILTDCRFSSPILTVVDGKVTEDTVAIGLSQNPTMLPNAQYGSNGKSTVGSGSQGTLVWISANGNKYHRNSSCSNMTDPRQVSRQEAISQGRDACKKCYG